ncbi:SDR family oxidoreductase [Neobacillus terrae]|uniref:SDR family oxidoreductase n=1 Tax=Neobacillus terrae TaxID=3034837 RepID=UPI00140AD1C2|nr:SDR family oxidoreductase [Neobacillus terrae]NHM29590.1 SDR family oxidoreductase [Neobacillus terrae]
MVYKNKTVIVTGAAHGIGRAVAEMYSKQGANVIIADVDEERGRQAEEELKADGSGAVFIKTDVKDEENIKALFQTAAEKFEKIDILINNAGISKFIPFMELTSPQWDEIINTNLKSVFLCSKEAAKYMKETGGHIINIASTRAFMSEPNTEAYSASKGGIIALTHALARTLGPDKILVNSISPGWIQTEKYDELSRLDHEQHLSGRVGKPEDVARCCLFLTDPKNDFITAENIVLDGGMTRKMIYEEL